MSRVLHTHIATYSTSHAIQSRETLPLLSDQVYFRPKIALKVFHTFLFVPPRKPIKTGTLFAFSLGVACICSKRIKTSSSESTSDVGAEPISLDFFFTRIFKENSKLTEYSTDLSHLLGQYVSSSDSEENGLCGGEAQISSTHPK